MIGVIMVSLDTGEIKIFWATSQEILQISIDEGRKMGYAIYQKIEREP